MLQGAEGPLVLVGWRVTVPKTGLGPAVPDVGYRVGGGFRVEEPVVGVGTGIVVGVTVGVAATGVGVKGVVVTGGTGVEGAVTVPVGPAGPMLADPIET